MPRTSADRRPASTPAAVKETGPSTPRPNDGYRETVESIAIAFILAMVAKPFAAEAFVIPTGSMAPTLMGRHKEVTCPKCEYVYSVNAAEEVEGVPPERIGQVRVATGVCVNCRYQANLLDEPSFKGDRILVMKSLYDLPNLPGSSPPRRWDVIVFHYPEMPDQNYIKRLVGLPEETLRVWRGDIFIKPKGANAFRQERRPLLHQRAMQMMVYDDAHRASPFRDKPEWARWAPTAAESWAEETTESGTFRAKGGGTDWAELRYRHVVPDPDQWRAVEAGEALAKPPRPTLVTDFYSYNTGSVIDRSRPDSPLFHDSEGAWMQPHWVGDLTVSLRAECASATGLVRLDLIEGGVTNRAEIDLSTGQATLFHGEVELGKAGSPFKGAGAHDLEFANVDNRLTLWVDGAPVFGDGLAYEDDPEAPPQPTLEDLAPVRIAAKGAELVASRLVLKRDIYYTQNPGYLDYGNAWDSRMPRTAAELFDLLADPARVAELGPLSWTDYEIGEDRFLMLGDNSPRSKDSRGWHSGDMDWDTTGRKRWEVPGSMIVGKAFSIYWPHGKPFGPDFRLNPDFSVPFRPYVERMGLIR